MSHSPHARRRARCLGTLITLGLCALGVSGTAAATGGPKGGTHAIRQITCCRTAPTSFPGVTRSSPSIWAVAGRRRSE